MGPKVSAPNNNSQGAWQHLLLLKCLSAHCQNTRPNQAHPVPMILPGPPGRLGHRPTLVLGRPEHFRRLEVIEGPC